MPLMPRVAIIGGGIGGLTAAIALRRRGIEALVFEQAGALGDIGAGIQLGPNAVKTFRALGMEDEIAAIAFESEYQTIRSWRSGRIISRQRRKDVLRSRFGAPHYTLHRADLLEVLSRALPVDGVKLSARCTGIEMTGGAAVARFADGGVVEADAIVGADGIHSIVRASLFGAEAPRFTGCLCWRGLVPIDRVPKNIITTDGTAWWGPHGHIVHYLVRRGELVNFVAHYDSDAWTEESWTRECDRAELLETYAGWNEALLRLIECSGRYFKWALYDRDPLERWSKGRATLLGDSAHAMLPYLAQGACMAVEDGYILAETLSRSPEDIPDALARYEALRIPRTRRTVLGSRFRAKENHLASPWKRLVRDVKIAVHDRLHPGDTIFRATWLYDYDVAAEHIEPAPNVAANSRAAARR
jgi:2-polyprenyl-6-methoxyphenol hydroxylase-like FAD-dependent oxidoreductase